MDRSDGDFETFLRQFQPSRPGPLPAPRRTPFWVAATAGIVAAAAVVTMVFWTGGPSVDAPIPTPTPAAPPTPGAPADGPAGTGGGLRSGVAAGGAGTSAPSPEPAQTASPTQDLPAISFRGSGRPDPPVPNGVAAATGGVAGRVKVGGAIRPPIKLVNVPPEYPEDAQAAGIEGVVTLGIVIGEDGSVIETWIVGSIPELDQAAIDAVSQWVFETTTVNGEPVEVEMYVQLNFTLA
jgi:TonB family protein